MSRHVCGYWVLAVIVLVWVCSALQAGEHLEGTTTIDNEVSRKENWAAGSYVAHPKNEVELVLNTRPKAGNELKEEASKLIVRGDDVLWVFAPPPTRQLHTWKATEVLGRRIYVKVKGDFIPKPTGGTRKGTGTVTVKPDPTWQSNSLDVDIDVGKRPRDNTTEEDRKEMDQDN